MKNKAITVTGKKYGLLGYQLQSFKVQIKDGETIFQGHLHFE